MRVRRDGLLAHVRVAAGAALRRRRVVHDLGALRRGVHHRVPSAGAVAVHHVAPRRSRRREGRASRRRRVSAAVADAPVVRVARAARRVGVEPRERAARRAVAVAVEFREDFERLRKRGEGSGGWGVGPLRGCISVYACTIS
eukprot:gene1014-biopygen21236